MPKLVNHEERRKQIAEATWRVILEHGMEGATVRNIAKEAGLSLGALRHYFTTQEELLVYAMDLVKEKATARIQNIASQNLPVKETVLRILLELIPVNNDQIAEMEVWFAFITYFKHKKDTFDPRYDGIFSAIQNMMNYLEKENMLRKNLDKDIESEKLYSLIDGLALHAWLEPQRVNQDRILIVLRHYLNTIFDT